MILILKIERAVAFAKELGLSDEQTKELMVLILELPNFKMTPIYTPPITQPTPWTPFGPTYGDCPGIVPPVYTSDPMVISSSDKKYIQTNDNLVGCSCAPVGRPHDDSCKAYGINAGRTLQKSPL
jgi:hypothetical protein